MDLFKPGGAGAKIKGLFGGIIGAFKAGGLGLVKVLSLLWGAARKKLTFLDRFLSQIPGEKRSLLIKILGGVLGFCLLLAAAGMIMNRPPRGGGEQPAARQAAGPRISMDELFLPDEPDTAPGLLLGRERREAWDAADGEPFWTNPGDWGDEDWRRRMSAEIDKLMESIP
jgi:hypothetical protein